MVPKGWKSVYLNDISEKIMVGIASAATHAYCDDGIRMLRNLNIKDGWIDDSDILFVNEEYEKQHKNKRLKTGDILTVRTGYPGVSAVVPEKYNNAQCFTSLITRLNTSNALPAYICRFINSEYGKKYITSGEAGGAQKNVNAAILKKMRIPLPPLLEQQKIANILSTWDKAISTTERLIENSTQQKKALMQQLLTGKKRFGYKDITYNFQKTRYGDIPVDWEYPAIEDISVQLSKKNTDGKDYPVVSCSKHYGFVDSLDYFKKKVYSDDTSGYRIIPRNAFGFPSNHIEEGSIGVQTVHDIAIASPIYVVFKADPKLINNVYLYALLKTEHYRQIFCAATNASVDRRGSLRWKEFSAIRIPLPPLKEQQKIATVLTNADKEIELLKQQLADLQQEKKALMQVLLTGKKRVVVDGEAI